MLPDRRDARRIAGGAAGRYNATGVFGAAGGIDPDMLLAQNPQAVHYIPLATTALAAVFFVVLLARYLRKGARGAHLLWWASGVFAYGLGTGLEGSITLFGNTVALTKAWYIAGALLGGYPLAQGTVYLLLRRRTAHILTAITLPLIVIASVCVVASPVNLDELLPYKPSIHVVAWTWLIAAVPIVNTYAALFLIGGAVLSAYRFSRKSATRNRAVGNSLIAFGAMLPAIGGYMARLGFVEALYVGEFVGLIFIWAGYAACVKPAPYARAEHTAVEPAS